MNKNQKSEVLENIKIAKDTYRLTMTTECENIAAGQFLSILCENRTLRRPFSISGFCDNKVQILYKLKGEGTKYISSLSCGDKVEYLCPLGRGFDIKDKKNALLVGAGIGIAPMLFLKAELEKNNIKNFLISGFKADDEIIEGSDKTVVGASVLDYVDDLVSNLKPDVIYSCGPSIVLKLISILGKKYNIETQIAMEKTMACSIGVCRGCVIELINGENKTVCKDGPVFRGDEVKW